jgi:hypothetical protein
MVELGSRRRETAEEVFGGETRRDPLDRWLKREINSAFGYSRKLLKFKKREKSLRRLGYQIELKDPLFSFYLSQAFRVRLQNNSLLF